MIDGERARERGRLRVACALIAAAAALPACKQTKPRQLDHDLIHVLPTARLRTDTVGEHQFASRATFVLVDARNTARTGADVTLAGELTDAAGKRVGELRAQSLWIPAGGVRTFALIDSAQRPRPTAVGAKVYVRGAMVPPAPPIAHVGELHEIVDEGRIVVQGTLHNDAQFGGNVLVIAAFHDAAGRPMTRPFAVIHVRAHATQALQFVGPKGSKHGTIFVGDAVY